MVHINSNTWEKGPIHKEEEASCRQGRMEDISKEMEENLFKVVLPGSTSGQMVGTTHKYPTNLICERLTN